tara:strand:- start:735 stop:1148 length:414 start_codon:yes stop_codon:yes gene_type:complete
VGSNPTLTAILDGDYMKNIIYDDFGNIDYWKSSRLIFRDALRGVKTNAHLQARLDHQNDNEVTFYFCFKDDRESATREERLEILATVSGIVADNFNEHPLRALVVTMNDDIYPTRTAPNRVALRVCITFKKLSRWQI